MTTEVTNETLMAALLELKAGTEALAVDLSALLREQADQERRLSEARGGRRAGGIVSTLTPKTRTEGWAAFAEMRHELDALERRVAEVELLAVTIQRASVMTSLRQKDIRDAIYGGTLPALKVGRRLVILTPDLRTWLEGLKQAQAAGGMR